MNIAASPTDRRFSMILPFDRTLGFWSQYMTDDDEALRKICGTTLDATERWNGQSSKERLMDGKVAALMSNLYFAGRKILSFISAAR
jgi:hypothetical protein